jgi:hypothetical protein
MRKAQDLVKRCGKKTKPERTHPDDPQGIKIPKLKGDKARYRQDPNAYGKTPWSGLRRSQVEGRDDDDDDDDDDGGPPPSSRKSSSSKKSSKSASTTKSTKSARRWKETIKKLATEINKIDSDLIRIEGESIIVKKANGGEAKLNMNKRDGETSMAYSNRLAKVADKLNSFLGDLQGDDAGSTAPSVRASTAKSSKASSKASSRRGSVKMIEWHDKKDALREEALKAPWVEEDGEHLKCRVCGKRLKPKLGKTGGLGTGDFNKHLASKEHKKAVEEHKANGTYEDYMMEKHTGKGKRPQQKERSDKGKKHKRGAGAEMPHPPTLSHNTKPQHTWSSHEVNTYAEQPLNSTKRPVWGLVPAHIKYAGILPQGYTQLSGNIGPAHRWGGKSMGDQFSALRGLREAVLMPNSLVTIDGSGGKRPNNHKSTCPCKGERCVCQGKKQRERDELLYKHRN